MVVGMGSYGLGASQMDGRGGGFGLGEETFEGSKAFGLLLVSMYFRSGHDLFRLIDLT